jgi:NAD(P)H-hydrate epimerase
VPGDPCVRAAATLTLALPKTGLMTPDAKPFIGDLFLADISVPPELYRRIGLVVPPLFVSDTILYLS